MCQGNIIINLPNQDEYVNVPEEWEPSATRHVQFTFYEHLSTEPSRSRMPPLTETTREEMVLRCLPQTSCSSVVRLWFPLILILNPKPQWDDTRRWGATGGHLREPGGHRDEMNAFWKRPRSAPSPLPPCEGTRRRSRNRVVGPPHSDSDLWTSSLQNRGE